MGVWAGAKRSPFASPETGTKGTRRSISIAPVTRASDRDAGPSAPGKGHIMILREGSSPEGLRRKAAPGAQRVEPGPAQPDALWAAVN